MPLWMFLIFRRLRFVSFVLSFKLFFVSKQLNRGRNSKKKRKANEREEKRFKSMTTIKWKQLSELIWISRSNSNSNSSTATVVYLRNMICQLYIISYAGFNLLIWVVLLNFECDRKCRCILENQKFRIS